MNEDIINRLNALDAKISSYFKVIEKYSNNTEKMDLVLNAVYEYKDQAKNQRETILESIIPDILRRLNKIEDNRKFLKAGDIFKINTRRTKSKKIHLSILEDRLSLYCDGRLHECLYVDL